MRIRTLTILVLSALMLCLLTACEKESKPTPSTTITAEEAQEVALADAGIAAEDVLDIHSHVIAYEDVPSYSIHINVEGAEYEYVVAIATGKILYADDIL